MDTELKIKTVLREVASRSKLAASVFYLFALRERSRSRLTVRNLMLRMKAEGFNFDKADYLQFFNLLAECNIGHIERSSRGQLKALRDINFTLQSVGKVAVGKAERLETFKSRTHKRAGPQPVPFRPGLTVQKPLSKEVLVRLMVTVDKKPWILDLPKDYTEEDIAKIICMLNKN